MLDVFFDAGVLCWHLLARPRLKGLRIKRNGSSSDSEDVLCRSVGLLLRRPRTLATIRDSHLGASHTQTSLSLI